MDLRVPIAEIKNGQIILPFEANKNDCPFYCPDCKSELILKRGKIFIPHFAHKSQTHIVEGHKQKIQKLCHVSESTKHRAAKHIVAKEFNRINITRRCDCGVQISNRSFDKLKEIKSFIEKTIGENKYEVDVALINEKENKLLVVIEIYYTHKIGFEKRCYLETIMDDIKLPSVFEVDAQNVLSAYDNFLLQEKQENKIPFIELMDISHGKKCNTCLGLDTLKMNLFETNSQLAAFLYAKKMVPWCEENISINDRHDDICNQVFRNLDWKDAEQKEKDMFLHEALSILADFNTSPTNLPLVEFALKNGARIVENSQTEDLVKNLLNGKYQHRPYLPRIFMLQSLLHTYSQMLKHSFLNKCPDCYKIIKADQIQRYKRCYLCNQNRFNKNT